MTVRLLLVLLKGALVQLLQTEDTGKVLGVKLLKHGRYAATGDGLATGGTQCSALVVVVRLAEGLTFNVKVIATVKGQMTVLQITQVSLTVYKQKPQTNPADETVRVPVTAQSGYVVVDNGLRTA